MRLSDDELRKLRDLLITPFTAAAKRQYLISLAFPNDLNRRSVVTPDIGNPREFTWQLIDHYHQNDRNALLTILGVVQDEEGGDLARALQPFVEKLTPSHAEEAGYKIFVSYRRKSGFFMHSVVRDLRARMPNVEFFVDFSSMDNTDFGASIRTHLADSKCFLLMLTAETLDRQRLFDPEDWIRYEVRLALERGLPLIQVSDGTPFPRAEELPEDIRALAGREGRTIHLDLWDPTLQRLIDFIPRAIANPPAPVEIESPPVQVVEMPPTTPTDHQAMLERAIALNEQGAYEEALTLLEQLAAANYRPRVVTTYLDVAKEQRAKEEARLARLPQLREAYADVALLARSQSTMQAAREAWFTFLKDFPDWWQALNGDPENLSMRFPQRRTDPKTGAIMVYVLPGKFRIGSTEAQVNAAFEEGKRTYETTEKAWYEDQMPQHEQVIAQGFWLDLTPVTNAAYAKFVAAGGYRQRDLWTAAGWAWREQNSVSAPEDYNGFTAPDQPRVGISWYEAWAFAAWRGCRLPTEAEWEWAARGTENRAYAWGDDFMGSLEYVIYGGNSGDKTHPVGEGIRLKGAAWCGALDMSGNVFEWVSSLYKPYPYNAADGREAVDSTDMRALRGGSWYHLQDFARAAFRLNYDPVDRSDLIGVRLVAGVVLPSQSA